MLAATVTQAPYASLVRDASATNVMRHVEALAKAPRRTGTDGARTAADYILRTAQAAGWSARIEEHPAPWGGRVRNVVAERTGSGSRALVVAGAHYDSVNTPGANDNASGSAALLEVARVLAARPADRDIRLVWFDGEEAGLRGSRAHVRANPADVRRAVAMLNLEMVGAPHGRGHVLLGPRTDAQLGAGIQATTAAHGLKVTPRGRTSASDHAPFDEAGVPSAVIAGAAPDTVWNEDPNYHRPGDVPAAINQRLLEELTDAAAVTVATLAGASPDAPAPADGPA